MRCWPETSSITTNWGPCAARNSRRGPAAQTPTRPAPAPTAQSSCRSTPAFSGSAPARAKIMQRQAVDQDAGQRAPGAGSLRQIAETQAGRDGQRQPRLAAAPQCLGSCGSASLDRAGVNSAGRTRLRPRRRAARRPRSAPTAQLPRSSRRQRSLQKGKSASVAESVGLRQIGHWCFMDDLRDRAARCGSAQPPGSAPGGGQASTRSAAPVEIVRAGATAPALRSRATPRALPSRGPPDRNRATR